MCPLLRLFYPLILWGSGACFAFSGTPVSDERHHLELPAGSYVPQLADFESMTPQHRVLDNMLKIKGFTQREPQDGQPASQRTEVYLCRDDKNLYVVFLAFDTEPEKIRARISPREQIRLDDSVNIMIDTFNDRRRAYTFGANALGIQWDALWSEGRDFDRSFDAVWFSEAAMLPQGFVVKMTIPFKSLRYEPEGDQVWGLMFNRMIVRNSECSYWPPYTNRIQGRLNQAGRLSLTRPPKVNRNFQLIPYVGFRAFEFLDRDGEPPARISEHGETDVGADLKFVIDERFVLDLALNPDFSQIAPDEPQITVNQRFEVFFPERRPFFLENADLFQTPVRLVFTRRIADPRAGIRFSGKAGPLGFGFLSADDEAPGKGVSVDSPLAGENAKFGIVRLTRDVFEQSKIGFLYTGREFDGLFNHVFSLDSRILWNQNWVSDIQAAASITEVTGDRLNGHLATASLNREGRHFNTHIHYTERSENFFTQTGFLNRDQRADSRNFHVFTRYRFWPEGDRLISWGPNLFLNGTWSLDGTRLDRTINPSVTFFLKGQTEIQFGPSWSRERVLPREFTPLVGALDFSKQGWRFDFETALWQNYGLELEMRYGSEPNFETATDLAPQLADRFQGSLTFSSRPLTRLQMEQTLLFIGLEDREHGQTIFEDRVFRSNLNWQFNREWSLRLIAQYNDRDVLPERTRLTPGKRFNGDLLLTYLFNPWTALHVGYNSNYRNSDLFETENGPVIVDTGSRLERDSDQFFLKGSYLFR